MRGKGHRRVVDLRMYRITPAYAGKRLSHSSSEIVTEDHPRLCGEKDSWDIDFLRDLGSPPPMRGKAALSRYDRTACGITPAYAGKRIPLGRGRTPF